MNYDFNYAFKNVLRNLSFRSFCSGCTEMRLLTYLQTFVDRLQNFQK